MSYVLENLVRECSEIKSPSARLLAMVLASSADNKTFKCRPSWKCLMHWCKFGSKQTMSNAMKEVLASGIVTKFKKGRKSTTEYTFHVARLKELAVPFRQPEPPSGEELEKQEQYREQEVCEHDFGMSGRVKTCLLCGLSKAEWEASQKEQSASPEPVDWPDYDEEPKPKKVYCGYGDHCMNESCRNHDTQTGESPRVLLQRQERNDGLCEHPLARQLFVEAAREQYPEQALNSLVRVYTCACGKGHGQLYEQWADEAGIEVLWRKKDEEEEN